MTTITYKVPDVSCSHCQAAISREVGAVAGVETVDIDLETKTVTITGGPLSEQALVAAIDEAGYEVVA
jgi:copper chaperone CopZ